jgi:hypothetical protein
MSNPIDTADVIIVGGGSAGAVLVGLSTDGAIHTASPGDATSGGLDSAVVDAIDLVGGPARVMTLADEHAADLGIVLSAPTPDRAPEALDQTMPLLASGALHLRRQRHLPWGKRPRRIGYWRTAKPTRSSFSMPHDATGRLAPHRSIDPTASPTGPVHPHQAEVEIHICDASTRRAIWYCLATPAASGSLAEDELSGPGWFGDGDAVNITVAPG